MPGLGSAIAILMLAGSADAAPKPIGTAVDLASKWGVVTSVKRSAEHNRAVGGAPNSWHLHGRAIDIARRPGVRHADIDAALRKAGFHIIESLDEGDHSHFAFGRAGEQAEAKPAAGQRRPALTLASAERQCGAAPSGEAVSRRRPDRDDGCSASAPAPRLRPLDPAGDVSLAVAASSD